MLSPSLSSSRIYRHFLDPLRVAKLSRMDLRARLIVEGFLAGLHKSPYRGFSVEYAEHRQYMPGDPIKHIDWKIYAKSDRFFIKEYEEETNLKAYLILDVSASMGYPTGSLSKLTYASYLAAALTYLMLKQRDAVGLVTFDETLKTYIPPHSTKSHLYILLKHLDQIKPTAGTQMSATFHKMAERIKRRGLILILSDLFDEPEQIISGIKHFRHRKHEVILFHILNPTEREFPFDEAINFRDMETGEEILTHSREIRSSYLEKMEEVLSFFKRACQENLVDYVLLDTATPFDHALLSFLGKRKRLL